MTLDPQVAMLFAVPAIGVIVWLVRLEGRVNLADERHADLKADIGEIKQDVRKIRAFMGGGIER